MAVETSTHLEEEIKLTAPNQEVLAAVLRDPWVCALAEDQPPVDRSFLATYYDTPDRALLRARWGLRMRQVTDDQWWVELKGRGSLVAGVARHEELQACSALPVATLGSLPPGPVRDQALCAARTDPAAAALLPLLPLLTTDIQRRILMLTLPDGCQVELAVDAGIIRAGAKVTSVCEVELELIAGSSLSLQHLADTLTQRHPLTPATQTKFQKGIALLDPIQV
ncbi:MAG: CYTH domain-containing protein [Magnetococcales bacterium]|nr:CYTH domain-containing protein [Magnetococcales bacterium]